MIKYDVESKAILRTIEPNDRMIDAVWRNMPSAYEIDIEDYNAAIKLISSILSVALQEG